MGKNRKHDTAPSAPTPETPAPATEAPAELKVVHAGIASWSNRQPVEGLDYPVVTQQVWAAAWEHEDGSVSVVAQDIPLVTSQASSYTPPRGTWTGLISFLRGMRGQLDAEHTDLRVYCDSNAVAEQYAAALDDANRDMRSKARRESERFVRFSLRAQLSSPSVSLALDIAKAICDGKMTTGRMDYTAEEFAEYKALNLGKEAAEDDVPVARQAPSDIWAATC